MPAAGDRQTRHADPLADEFTERGTSELRHNRPYAARAHLLQALRVEPAHEEARARLHALDQDDALPATARRDLTRLRTAVDAAARARRDACFAKMAITHADPLAQTVVLYEYLTEADPKDVDAWLNLASSLAWQGRNLEAIEALEHVVELSAGHNFDAAVDAWALAEILRAGIDNPALLDEKSCVCHLTTSLPRAADRLADEPRARRLPTHCDDATVDFNLFDRPASEVDEDSPRLADLPRFLALVKSADDSIWVVSHDQAAFETAVERMTLLYDDVLKAAERGEQPVPLVGLDHEIWDAAPPPRADLETQARLRRELVEDYYENRWIHKPRHGLMGMSPYHAALAALDGDDVSRARLLAVIRIREELGARPRLARSYQGYPFDRLRRRLGLEPLVPIAVDDTDLAYQPIQVLQGLEPADLDPYRLIEAFRSAEGLRDDALAARFGREALDRAADMLDRHDARAILATRTRFELHRGAPEIAVFELGAAETLAAGACRATFRRWRAEVLARTDRGDDAADVYNQMLAETSDAPAEIALDAALTFQDNGRPDLAALFARQAVALARAAGKPGVAHRASTILNTTPSDHDD